jgi:hypothetical protein
MKKIWANFQRIIEVFTQKLSLSSQKYWFGIRDPRSGKNLFWILDPGVKRHRIPDPDPQHCFQCTATRGTPACGEQLLFLPNVDCGESYLPDHLVEECGIPVGLGPQGEQHGVHILLHLLQGSGLENIPGFSQCRTVQYCIVILMTLSTPGTV